MVGLSLAGAIARAQMRSIKFKWLFRTLELALDNTITDPFEALAELRSTDKGNLKLTPSEDECLGHENPIHHGDISVALGKVKRDYRQLEEDAWNAPDGVNVWGSKRAAAIWRHEVSVCAGTPHEYTLAVGDLWVNEADFAAACRRLCLTTYHWPRVPWPQQSNDIEERPITGADGAATPKEAARGAGPVEVVSPAAKPTAEEFTKDYAHKCWVKERDEGTGAKDMTSITQMALLLVSVLKQAGYGEYTQGQTRRWAAAVHEELGLPKHKGGRPA